MNLDTLELEISASSENAAKKIRALSAAMLDLQKVLSGKTDNLSRISSQLRELGDAASELEGSSDSLEKTAQVLEKISNLKRLTIPKRFVDSIRDLGTATKSISHKSVSVLEGMSQAIQRVSGVNLDGFRSLSNFNFPEIPTTAGKAITNIAKATEKLSTKQLQSIQAFADSLRGLANVDLSGLSASLKSLSDKAFVDSEKKATGIMSAMRQRVKLSVDSSDVTKATKKVSLLAKTMNSLKRIAFYRVIRSGLKAVGEAFSEGEERAYQFSKTLGEQTKYIAEAFDGLSSSSFTMENQLGAAWATLKAAIAPVLIEIMNLATAAASALTQFFAVLGGRGTYLKAINYSKDWADATASGAASAKEWKNQLMGFDEINRLEEPSTGGGGGGSKGPTDYGNMFEEAPVDSWFQHVKDKLSELKESLNFEPLKKAWGDLGESVKRLGADIVSALGWAWDNILTPLAHWTIESALPAGIELLANALDLLRVVGEKLSPIFTTLWENVFQPMASWIGDKFVVAVQWLADTFRSLKEKIEGASSLSEFIQSLEGKERNIFAIATAITAVVGGLKLFSLIRTTVSTAGSIISGAFAAMTSPVGLVIIGIAAVVDGLVYLYQHSEKFRTDVDELIEGLKTEWQSFTDTVTGAIDAVKRFFNTLLSNPLDLLKQPAVGNVGGLESAFSDTKANTYASSYANRWSGYAQRQESGSGSGNWFDNLISSVKTALSEVKTAESGITDSSETIQNAVGDTNKLVLASFKKMNLGAAESNNNIAAAFNSIKNKVTTTGTSISTNIKTTWTQASTTISGKVSSIKTNVTSAFDTVKSNVSDRVKTLQDNATSGFDKLKTNITTTVAALKSSLTTDFDTIKTNLSNAVSSTKENAANTFGSMKTRLSSTASGLSSSLASTFSSIQSTITNSVNTARNNAVGSFNSLLSSAQSVVGSIKNAFNFQWQLPSFKLPHLTWSWQDVTGSTIAKFLGVSSIPHFSVQWYAKGGIVDGATLIGAGEAGKEAIIPLERNTEWISKVAREMNAQQGSGESIADGIEDSGVVSVLYQILSVAQDISRNDNSGGNMDFDAFVRRVTKAQRQQARAAG